MNTIYNNYRRELEVVEARLTRGDLGWSEADRLVAELRCDWDNPGRRRGSCECEATIEALFEAVSQTIAARREESQTLTCIQRNPYKSASDEMGWNEEG